MEESGEHTILGTGEVYLDSLMKDLRELYAGGGCQARVGVGCRVAMLAEHALACETSNADPSPPVVPSALSKWGIGVHFAFDVAAVWTGPCGLAAQLTRF